MIVWLASYPRSGNTALRILLHSAFGVATHSEYDDPLDIAVNPAVRAAAGHVDHGLVPAEFVARATASDETFLVKTHGPPVDDAPAIYVVRDGRSACVSYLHWIRRYLPDLGVTLGDVVAGRIDHGSWSAHLEDWAPRTRPRTLFLTFEEVVAPTPATLAALSAVIGVAPRSADAVPSFGALNAREPGFFRAGSDARNIAELAGDDLDLFWWLHGPAMVAYGYASEIPAPRPGWSPRRAYLDAAQRSWAAAAPSGPRLEEVAPGPAGWTAEAQALLAARTAEAARLRRRLEALRGSRVLRVSHRLGVSRALRSIEAELAVPRARPRDADS